MRLMQDVALETVIFVCGKAERMLAHVKKCRFISSDNCTYIILTCRKPDKIPPHVSVPSPLASLHVSTAAATVAPVAVQNYSHPVKRSKSLQGITSGGIQTLAKTLSASQLQEEFSADLAKLLIALNTAWVAADNPSLHRFINK
jgi:hypothetical protein